MKGVPSDNGEILLGGTVLRPERNAVMSLSIQAHLESHDERRPLDLHKRHVDVARVAVRKVLGAVELRARQPRPQPLAQPRLKLFTVGAVSGHILLQYWGRKDKETLRCIIACMRQGGVVNGWARGGMAVRGAEGARRRVAWQGTCGSGPRVEFHFAKQQLSGHELDLRTSSS